MEIDGFIVRAGTTDRYAVAETRRIFRRSGGPTKEDVVLDLGAHIGSFTGRALRVGAVVVAVEPEPTNCDVWYQNIGDEAELIEAAVAREDGETELFLASTYGHTIVPGRGRESITVPTVGFRGLCDRVQPTFIKMDIEGAEYELDLPGSIPESTTRLFIEFHLTFGNRAKGIALRREFLDSGWELVWEVGAGDKANMEGLFRRT